ncbi:hypothetical protein PVAND_006756 [Polypedilum vanderplanki]|uniref:Uncharacterized protein n=1 Tax=Polypedilum vanderplanki TaxID=319348 RepID=A0A9J6C466_POLVA|nr:hypothetical protein PVAND_006756 [Polypedilum vanderplanki]
MKCDLRKILQFYMCSEFIIWAFLSYTTIYYGKIFDYRFTDTTQFVQNIDTNLYYTIVFGHLNLTYRDVKEQRAIQVKCDMLNTLFVFVCGTYFVLSILFIIGLTKSLGSKCLLCPYVTYDTSVVITVAVFTIYGIYEHYEIVGRNGDIFLIIKILPSILVHVYYRKL